MPETFKYLTQYGRGSSEVRSSSKAVESKYSTTDLASRTVICSESMTGRQFLVFESTDEFFDWYNKLADNQRCCHEVIFGNRYQRIKFDIDALSSKVDEIPDNDVASAMASANIKAVSAATEADLRIMDIFNITETKVDCRTEKMHNIMRVLLEAILDELHDGYYGVIDGFNPTLSDLVVTDSSGQTTAGWKYSYHILTLPYYVASNEEAREFTTQVLSRLPAGFKKIIDGGVNKRLQNFRFVGSTKPGAGRYKRATVEIAAALGTAVGVQMSNMFVTAPAGVAAMPRIYTTEPYASDATPAAEYSSRDELVKQILIVTAEAIQHHTLIEVRGTLMCFERNKPSYCKICCEMHHNDNTLMLGFNVSNGVSCLVFEHCRHVRGKSRLVGEFPLDDDINDTAGQPQMDRPKMKLSLIESHIARLLDGSYNPRQVTSSKFEHLPTKQLHAYSEINMRPYSLVPTLAIRAQMKLGKTKAMKAYVDKYFPANGINPPVIRSISSRKTFTESIKEDFPSFEVYSDIEGSIDHIAHPRVIMQVESLHRLTMANNAEPIDLLILDEVESLIAQFNSGLHKNLNKSFAMFSWMVRTSRHVVCMDANIGDRTYTMLEKMRPSCLINFHWNKFKRAADDKYYFTANQGAWLNVMHTQLQGGKKIVIASNSLSEARAYCENIKHEFPNKRVMLYSSENSVSEKALHFGDVHTYWGSLDVLIYTPTCSAGVSFELEHYDTLFAYFCDVSCDVETCRQMMGRVRNLSTKEHYICISARGASLPATTEEIKKCIYDKRARLRFPSIDTSPLQFDYADDGTMIYHESTYFHIWLETIRVENLSKNDYARRLISQISDTGASIATLEVTELGAGAALLLMHTNSRTAQKVAISNSIAGADNITSEEAAHVCDLIHAQLDVTPELKLANTKYQLMEKYSWHNRTVTPEFVQKYDNFKAHSVYRNLIQISKMGSVDESLMRIRSQEYSKFTYLMNDRKNSGSNSAESRDLMRGDSTYVFDTHSIAIWLIRICMLRFGCTDKVHEAILETQLRSCIPILVKRMGMICNTYSIKKPNLFHVLLETDRRKFISTVLRTINPILRQTYGLFVSKSKKRDGGDTYSLEQGSVGKLFVFSQEPQPDDTPGGPKPHIPSNLVLDNDNSNAELFLDMAYIEGYERARIDSSSDEEPMAELDDAPVQIYDRPQIQEQMDDVGDFLDEF